MELLAFDSGGDDPAKTHIEAATRSGSSLRGSSPRPALRDMVAAYLLEKRPY